MSTTRQLSIALLLAALLGSAAADGLTRQQVRDELAEARRTGNIDAGGEVGLKLNELYPEQYPARAALPGRTRDEVRAELAEARRTGDLIVGEAGLRLNEYEALRYPAVDGMPGKTRAEVKSELAEARLLGELQQGEAGSTLAEEFPQLYAGVRSEHQAHARQLAESQ